MSETLSRAAIDIERLDDLQRLIGIGKMRDALDAFRQHLIVTRSVVVQTDTPSHDYILAQAHKMTSSAGSLGFVDLATTSRFVLDTAPGKAREHDYPNALTAFKGAIDDALAALEIL